MNYRGRTNDSLVVRSAAVRGLLSLMMSSLASTGYLDSAFDGGHALRDIASGSGSAASPPRSKGPREAAKPTSGRASDDDVEVLKHIARGLEQRQVRKYLALGRSSD